MIGYAFLGIFAVFFGVVLFRTALFRAKMQPVTDVKPEEFDREKTVEALVELVKCKTISYNDPALED